MFSLMNSLTGTYKIVRALKHTVNMTHDRSQFMPLETHAKEKDPLYVNKTNQRTETKPWLLARLRLFDTQGYGLESKDHRRPCWRWSLSVLFFKTLAS